jgi:hypothetical protein
MTWTRTGDEFADECWTLSDAAYRLHHEGLTWSNRKSCDGKLAKDDMVRWAKRLDAAEELVAIGWWKDHGDHYQIVHHIGYQRTAEQIAHQSEVNRKAANKRWGSRNPKPAQEDSSNESQCETHNESQCEQARTGQDWPRQENAQKNSASNGHESFEEYNSRAGVRVNPNEFEAAIRANVERGYE